MDVELPQERQLGPHYETFPLFRPHVTRSLCDLTIRASSVSPPEGSSHHVRQHHEGIGPDERVRELLAHIPEQQLVSFSLLHDQPLSSSTYGLLATRQASSLKHLRIFQLRKLDGSPNGLTLRSFECRSVMDGSSVGRLLKSNRETLQALSLGQEHDLVAQYRGTRGTGFLPRLALSSNAFTSLLELHVLPNLRRLDLCALDVTSLVPADFVQASALCRLTRLSLESCPGSDILLNSLARTFDFVQNSPDAPHPRIAPQLKELVLRSEAPTSILKENLINFLSSFSGLTTLSLLFENASVLERPATLIASHGPTLETLVLESRIQPRTSLALDTSRPLGAGGFSSDPWTESITDICSLCPNLIELGIGFPWNDEMVRIRKTPLPTLKRLRTIHIRNFPASQHLSQLGDYTIKEHATKFVEWVFPGLTGGDKPSLETLAIGPTVYEGRWKHGATRREPAEWARTHYFCLDWAQTRFKRWSCLVSPVSEKCIEELRDEKPLGGVFEGIWLR